MNRVEFLKRNIHYFIVISLSMILLLIMLNNSYWNKKRVIRWDVYGYTQYLSSTFVYNDLKNAKGLNAIDSAYRPCGNTMFYGRYYVNSDSGAVVFKYTMGNAVLMAPFYLTAHYINKAFLEYPADGYSVPYQFAISISAWFWALCGMVVLALLLRKWFNPIVTGITLLLIVSGTNYLYYATLEPGMMHIPGFFCIAAALLSCYNWLQTKSWVYAIFFGFAAGLVALIRLPDLVFGIVPAALFLQMYLKADKSGRLSLLMQGSVVVLLIFAIFSPQMIYWKYVSGHWFYYSYVGERFVFSDPQIINGLFSYKKGWLLYTPVMLFAIGGLIPAMKKMLWLAAGILLFLCINIYVVFSWEMWWYGGSFGARCMIQSYAILAIALAFTIQWITIQFYQNGIGRKLVAGNLCIILLLLVALNLFQTYQYKRGTIHYDSMTKKSYWGIWGKLSLSDEEYHEFYD